MEKNLVPMFTHDPYTGKTYYHGFNSSTVENYDELYGEGEDEQNKREET